MKQVNILILILIFLVSSGKVMAQVPPNSSIPTAIVVNTFPYTDVNVNTSLGGTNTPLTGGCFPACCSTAVYRVEIPSNGTLRVESSLYTPLAGFILGYTSMVPVPADDSDLEFYPAIGNFCGFRDTMVLSDVSEGDVYYVLAGNHNSQTGAGANSDFIFTFEANCEETTSSIDIITCDDYISPSGNYTWTTSGTYMDTIPNAAECDSVITINLTNNSNTGIDTQTECDTYTWIDGVEYTESNDIATHTLTNVAGCDSVVTLNLTINNSNTGTDVQTACDSYTWIDGIEYTESNDIATHTLTNIGGCDSVVTLNLTINNSNTGTDVQTACDSYTWIDGIEYTESNDEATHTLTNVAGCDSVVTLNLTINNSNTGTDIQDACDTYTWIDGIEYTESNDEATHTLTNVAGCDSVVTLDLTINYSNMGTDVQTACDTYTWIDGNEYIESNDIATFTLTNIAGCDSIVTLNLTMNYSAIDTIAVITCDSYDWLGETYTESGFYSEELFTAAGCDSITVLNLTINESYSITEEVAICSEDTYTFPDGTVVTDFEDGLVHTSNLLTVEDCDSIIVTTLLVSEEPIVIAEVDISEVCLGEVYTLSHSGDAASYNWGEGVPDDGTVLQEEAGIYNHILTGIGEGGCSASDMITIVVHELPIVSAGIDQTECEGGEMVLEAEGATTFEWTGGISDGESFIVMVGETVYTVTGTDENGCQDTDEIIITGVDLPVIEATISHEYTGFDGHIELLISEGSGDYIYEWSNGYITPNITGLTAGDYTVIVDDATIGEGICPTVDSTFTILSFVSLQENISEMVRVFPNPTNDQVTIASKGEFNYSLFSMDGKLIISGSGKNSTQLSLHELTAGSYLVEVRTENTPVRIQIIKN